MEKVEEQLMQTAFLLSIISLRFIYGYWKKISEPLLSIKNGFYFDGQENMRTWKTC